VDCGVRHRYRPTGVSGDGDGQTRLTQAGGSSFDPVYSPPRGACYQYAIVTEKTSTTKNVKICGTDRRERNVYTSRSNVVEVRFITSATVETDKEYYFLLQFEGLSRPPRLLAVPLLYHNECRAFSPYHHHHAPIYIKQSTATENWH